MITNPTTLYDSLYQLASDVAENELFGTSAALAHEAFQRSLAGNIMPTVWFELQLLGNPRFDLHVAYGNGDLHACGPFAPDAADGHGTLLNWYASEPRHGSGLALAYDVGDGRIADPAVHANVNEAGAFGVESFFSCVGRPDATALYDGFVKRMPAGWRVWYFGVHPGRAGAPVRIDCFVDSAAREAYEADLQCFEADLAQAGFAATSADVLRIADQILRSPFNFELQYDVLSDGQVGSTVGLSAGFPVVPASQVRPLWHPGGPVATLLSFAEALGIADSRWHHVADALFTNCVVEDGQMLALYGVPVFVKFRVRDGKPLDAKVYLQAGTKRLA